jgi:hypothetical protein
METAAEAPIRTIIIIIAGVTITITIETTIIITAVTSTSYAPVGRRIIALRAMTSQEAAVIAASTARIVVEVRSRIEAIIVRTVEALTIMKHTMSMPINHIITTKISLIKK